MRRVWLLAAMAIGLGPAAVAARAHYAATIVRTTFGIPHITAKDWGGIGYGTGYAYAQDNLCLLAEEFATVAGERSTWFGPAATSVLGFDRIDNLTSDVAMRVLIDLPALRRGSRSDTPGARLVAGYVAGYNRWLRAIGPAGVPIACRGKGWVRPIIRDDMLRLNEKQMLLAGSLVLAPAVAAAAPPGGRAKASIDLPPDHETGIGSNGWAFGGDVTADGRGLVVGNPHFPWNGPARFWEMHVTIPGKIDAMGVGIAGSPFPTLGFNRDVAWTHTVTAARHFTLFELKLSSPTTYLIDGKPEPMRRTTITVPMPDGTPPVTRTLYATRYGPLVALPAAGLAWTPTTALALGDANHGNQRNLDAWLGIARARSVDEVRRSVATTLGIPWVNTIAADRHGDVLLADVTAVPNVSAALAKDCATPRAALVAVRLTLLDGSRAACAWAHGAAHPAGLMPATDQAVFTRRDYVANSNDSYWLTNAHAPAAALSPVLGPVGTERSLRTRSGLIEIDRALAAGKIDAGVAKGMIFADHSLAADLVVGPLLAACHGQDVAAACAALAKWDRDYNLDSRGAYLFSAFWLAARTIPGLWATKFDPADPVHTPRDLVTSCETGTKLFAALAAAAARLASEKIALDARWGDVQFAVRGDEHIPIHGGDGQLGVLDVQITTPTPGGVVPVHGSSYVQVVGFDNHGPVADAILSYSQSTDPSSPYFADQTRTFSVKQWHRLPFTPAEIAADGATPPLRLAE